MAKIEVIVVTPDGEEWDAEVDPNASFGSIEEAFVEGFIETGALSPNGNYKVRRPKGEITVGTVFVIDEVKPGIISIIGKRHR